MKRYSITCPKCKHQMSLAIAEQDDPVNGQEVDFICEDEAQ